MLGSSDPEPPPGGFPRAAQRTSKGFCNLTSPRFVFPGTLQEKRLSCSLSIFQAQRGGEGGIEGREWTNSKGKLLRSSLSEPADNPHCHHSINSDWLCGLCPAVRHWSVSLQWKVCWINSVRWEVQIEGTLKSSTKKWALFTRVFVRVLVSKLEASTNKHKAGYQVQEGPRATGRGQGSGWRQFFWRVLFDVSCYLNHERSLSISKWHDWMCRNTLKLYLSRSSRCSDQPRLSRHTTFFPTLLHSPPSPSQARVVLKFQQPC